MSKSTYMARRAQIAKAIGPHAIAILPGACDVNRNADTAYPFRQHSDFFYLTGFNESNALLVIDGLTEKSILFCAPRDAHEEMWTGKRIGPDAAKRNFGFHETRSNAPKNMIGPQLCTMIQGRHHAYYPKDMGADDGFVTIAPLIKHCHEERQGAFALHDIGELIGEMRIIKDPSELRAIRIAARRSARVHKEILGLVRPGMTEIELEAEITYRFRKAGGDPCHAYTPIVATGKNACTLHHVSTPRKLRDGDLVLVDAGGEFGCYASDITRTFPANGKWTEAQRLIYDIVLTAQKAAIREARVGRTLQEVHEIASVTMANGLLALGLLKSSTAEEAIASEELDRFFPHSTSHWLGLDVHDAGDYKYQEESGKKKRTRVLEHGMVITVEPGIYIRPAADVPREYWNIGIRIEDDVAVTEDGPVILSDLVPKDPDEIERIMRP